MKAHFYHYYFTESNSPKRFMHDLRPFLKQYCSCTNVDWKNSIIGKDGEQLMLFKTDLKDCYMLLATRSLDIIKAVDTKSFHPTDLADKLDKDETPGFAAFVVFDENALGIIPTHKGPRQKVLVEFINTAIQKLQIHDWKFGICSLGASISMSDAEKMAFIGSTSLTIGPKNPIWVKLKGMLGLDDRNVDYCVLTIKNKRNQNLKGIFSVMSAEAQGDDLEKFSIRGKNDAAERLADYFIESHGRLSKEIDADLENEIIASLGAAFTESRPKISAEISRIQKEEAEYEKKPGISALDCLGGAKHWSRVISA